MWKSCTSIRLLRNLVVSISSQWRSTDSNRHRRVETLEINNKSLSHLSDFQKLLVFLFDHFLFVCTSRRWESGKRRTIRSIWKTQFVSTIGDILKLLPIQSCFASIGFRNFAIFYVERMLGLYRNDRRRIINEFE